MSDVPSSSSKFSSLSVIAVGIIVFAILGAGGYYLFSLQGKDNLAVKESAFDRFSDEVVRKHLTSQANHTQQRLRTKVSGQSITTTIEIDATDRKKLTSRSILSDGTKNTAEVVVIGDTYYIKDMANNAWWMQAITEDLNDETTGSQLFDAEKYLNQLQNVSPSSTYTKLGEEPCGTLKCYKYALKEHDTLAATIWFDTEDFLLRKSERTVDDQTSTTDYSYDAITISVPTPNKPVAAGKSIFDYYHTPGAGGDGPSRELGAEERRQFEEIQRKLQAEE